MSDAAFVNKCPYPGCALEQEHDGIHVPRLRLSQRFHKWDPNSTACCPGFCEIGECRNIAVALYTTHEGKGLQVCAKCEDDLIANGWTKLDVPHLRQVSA